MKKRIFIIIVFVVSTFLLYNLFFSREKYIKKNQQVANCEDCFVKDEETAVKIAEDSLFVIYGKSKIKDERPYNIELKKNKMWIITGSLNQGMLDKYLYKGMPMFGGTFEIKINAKDGKIIHVTHYK
ncbi:YbbC/YhhH family protein [Chryseobacterium aahli]|uniref:YbbC/YhhH family protein n=1 Tax=Chryseobacterium aahli TaxID=1278643 RepID=UPI001F623A12|nr:YbbC/YhhH family protein [Chryseobacterium aahli]MCI3939355.1 YbbC/YhhH family protein [Chryseobacterium aahli]